MSKLKEKIVELAEIAKECPENLQTICFELLLRNYLESLSAKPNKNTDSEGSARSPILTQQSSPAVQPKPPPIEDVVKGQDDVAETDLHIKAKHFMKKYGVSIEHLNNLFYKDDGKIQPLYEDLKTTRLSEGQIRIALLQALRNGMSSGDFQATVEDIRAEASDRKCYDKSNFSANFTNNANLFGIEKFEKSISALKLSEDGRKELAEVIKELQ